MELRIIRRLRFKLLRGHELRSRRAALITSVTRCAEPVKIIYLTTGPLRDAKSEFHCPSSREKYASPVASTIELLSVRMGLLRKGLSLSGLSASYVDALGSREPLMSEAVVTRVMMRWRNDD